MDTFWGSGSVEGGALAFLPDFLAGYGRIAQCPGREYRVLYSMYNHKPRWGFGKSRAEWRMQRPLFVRTISDALGRYWQEGGQEDRGWTKYEEGHFVEWVRKKDWSSGGFDWDPAHVCLLWVELEKKRGRLPLFVFYHPCLFVCFLCFVYCKYACCCLIFSWFILILTKLCPFSCLFVLFFFKESMIVQLVNSWSKPSKISFSNDVSEFSPLGS